MEQKDCHPDATGTEGAPDFYIPAGTGVSKTGPGLEVVDARLIDSRRIELYWSAQVTGADREDAFEVTVGGMPVALTHWTLESDWAYGTIYQPKYQRTTIALEEAVDTARAELVEVRVKGRVRDFEDRVADTTRRYPCRFDPYYKNFHTSASGLVIKGPEDATMPMLELAGKIVDTMLAKHPEISKVLTDIHSDVALNGLKEDIFGLPEVRMGQRCILRRVGGFGGAEDNPTSCMYANNIIRLRTGRYSTCYPNELILCHELAHAIHLIGMRRLEDQTLWRRVQATYDHAMKAGLWPNSYASSNCEEYFATITTCWYDVFQEGVDGMWDGVRGPVNTREELAEYDPEACALMEEVYAPDRLPYPWDTNPDDYDIHGRPRRDLSHERPGVTLSLEDFQ